MIAIIGKGNVASHLFMALKDKTEVVMVDSRSLEGLPENTEVVLISVSDNAIEEVCDKIPKSNAIIAHTSGSIPMSALKRNKIGVFYPLQTFTKDIELNYGEIPVFIEGNSVEVTSRLKEIGALFSKDVREADSETRKQLHLASVFSCNFTNALAAISAKIMTEAGFDLSVLIPLMKQTVNKLEILSPEEAQTGPAVRGDSKVIEKHLEMLASQPSIQEIYKQITDLIQRNNVL